MNSEKNQTELDLESQAMQALEEFNQEKVARQQEKATREQKKGRKKKMWFVAQWVSLIVCIGIIIYQVPALISISKSDAKPIRHGTYDTDALTDQCINNLWQISKLIQEEKEPDYSSIVCPVSGKPYVIVRTDDDIIVHSPNPEQHGFKKIRISKKKPVPELIK